MTAFVFSPDTVSLLLLLILIGVGALVALALFRR